MVILWADFNAMNEDGSISLRTTGSRQSLKEHPEVRPGDRVVLTDLESLKAEAVVIRGERGLAAVVDEDTYEDLD